MPAGTFSFHTNVPVFVVGTDCETVNIPVDVAIMPLSAKAGDIPLFIEAKSAGDFANVYPKERLQQVIDNDPNVVYQIWEELKTIGADEIEDEGRVYGGGLKKIEPKELAKVACDGLRTVCEI